MATFFNQASISYGTNIINSNITEAELVGGIELTKTALSSSYEPGGNVVYEITVNNLGNTEYTGLTVTDNLGAYTIPDTETVVVPLTYVNGSLRFYLNGVLQPAPTVTAVGELQISNINIPPESIATFIYEADVNEFAPAAAGSTITNTVDVSGGSCVDALTASATVPVNEEPILTIAKAVCPATTTCNGQITYTLIIQNLGNTPINATDGVIVSDVFLPVLTNLTVTLNGQEITTPGGYTYNETTGEFATANGTITVPAAEFVQDPVTGVITTSPGVTVITITGTV